MSGLQGGLELTAALDRAGRTILRRQHFSPPIHISKPHHDGGWLVVNLASPSPGLLAGDRVIARVTVERAARLLITAPSANRIHATPEGYAELTQEYSVAIDAFLDVWPEYLIPQAGACYRQRTRLQVEPGGTLLWTESVAPGRTARDEVFAFTELRLATDLFLGDRQVIRERYALTPENLAGLRGQFPTGYYASIICVSPHLPAQSALLRKLTEQTIPGTTWLGATEVAPTVWTIKILATSSPDLRVLVGEVRGALFEILGCAPANLRRTTGEVASIPAKLIARGEGEG